MFLWNVFIRGKSKGIPGHLLSVWILRTRKPGRPATPAKKKQKSVCWGMTFMEHLQKNSHGWLDKVLNVKRIEIPVSNAPVKTAGRQQDWEAERVLCHFSQSRQERWDVIYFVFSAGIYTPPIDGGVLGHNGKVCSYAAPEMIIRYRCKNMRILVRPLNN